MQGNVAFQAIVDIKFAKISPNKLPFYAVLYLCLESSTMLQGLFVFNGSSEVIETLNFEDECSKKCEHFL